MLLPVRARAQFAHGASPCAHGDTCAHTVLLGSTYARTDINRACTGALSKVRSRLDARVPMGVVPYRCRPATVRTRVSTVYAQKIQAGSFSCTGPQDSFIYNRARTGFAHLRTVSFTYNCARTGNYPFAHGKSLFALAVAVRALSTHGPCWRGVVSAPGGRAPGGVSASPGAGVSSVFLFYR